MAQIQGKQRFFSLNFHKKAEKVQFCPEVRDFIAESCKSQTLYANCEGFYPRRVGSCRERKLLEEFIFKSMYGEDQSHSNSDKMMHVTQICDKMIFLSKKYNADGKIHFSVVWVYSFEYARRMKKAVPVFKIFKRKSGSEAVFLDTLLKFYESWDCYLENAELLESFICVPQHGEYRFDYETNMLVLEYFTSIKLNTNDNECLFGALPKKPYSQRVVRPLFSLISLFGDSFLYTICSYWHDWKSTIFHTAIYIILVWEKIRRDPDIALKTISGEAFMLLNKVIETKDFNNLLKYGKETLSAVFIPEFSALLDAQKVLEDISNEGAYFFELLLSEKKDWFEILKMFCFLFRNIRPVLAFASFIAPEFLIIKYLFWLLSIIENISEEASGSSEFSRIENCTLKIDKDSEPFEKNSLGLTTNHISSSSAFDSQYKVPLTAHLETQNGVILAKHISYKEVFSNLPSLETISANAVYNLVLDKVSTKFIEKEQSCPIDASFAELGMWVGKQDGYGIYLFPKASIPRLTRCITRLLKTEFSLTFRGISIAEVTSHFGKTLGFIFFPQEFSALGLFPLEVIEEEEESLLDCALEPLEVAWSRAFNKT